MYPKLEKPVSVDWRNLLFRWHFLFLTSFALVWSTSQPLLPHFGKWLQPILEPAMRALGGLFGLPENLSYFIQSDTTGLYLWVPFAALITLLGAIFWSILQKRRPSPNFKPAIRGFTAWYLAFHLLIYGFNKVFKWQFFLPEPNTLYTTVGQTHLDLLFWTTLGSSWGYTVFGGILEVMAGLLLLFRRTRLVGALLGAAIMLQVVVINFSFDISVKVFSLLLLFWSVVLFFPSLGRLLKFFTGKAVPAAKQEILAFSSPWMENGVKYGRFVLIFWLILSSLWPYLSSGNFNDDLAPRPALHGAWEVETFKIEGESVQKGNSGRWKNVYVHRRGYWIVELENGDFYDYELSYLTAQNKLLIRDHQENQSTLKWEKREEKRLRVYGDFFNSSLQLDLKPLPYRELPLLQNEFHWTIDQIK